MPNRDTNGLKYKRNLKLGMDELQWMQDEADERRRMAVLGMAAEPGWYGAFWPHGQAALGWTITDPATNGILRLQLSSAGNPFGPLRRRSSIATFVGAAPNGRPVELDTEDNTTLRDVDDEFITVPDDGVWYTLCAVPVLQSRAPGRLTMTAGSAVVVGVRTDFTRFGDSTDIRATRFRISAADGDTGAGNEGTYRFDTITDATTATLDRPAVNDETGVHFRVIGDYLGSVPADPDIHSVIMTVWELRARTVTPPADALIAFDVMRDTGVQAAAFIIDRRHAMLYRPIHTQHNRRYSLQPVIDVEGATPWLAIQKTRNVVLDGAIDVQNCCLAPASAGADTQQGALTGDQTGCMLAVVSVDIGATFNLRVREYVPWASPVWRNPNGGGSVSINASITLAEDHQSALVCLPSGSGWTHAFFLTDAAGEVQMYRSTNNGATWDSPVGIWDPDANAAGDVASHLSAILTRTGRLIVVTNYTPVATGDGTIRYVFSDDYGDTWDTNSDAGTGIVQTAGEDLTHPCIVEDDEGNLWTSFTRGDHTRLVRGAGLHNPTPDSETPTGGFAVTSAKTSDTRGKASLVAAPDGTIVVIYQDVVNGVTNDVWASYVSRGQIIHSAKIGGISDTGTTFLSMAVGVDAGGYVHVLHEAVAANRSCVDETYTLTAGARCGYDFPQ